jgi:hypothetical protein
MSPRGKVLTEIYGEANRRSPGGTSVPSSLVLPTPAGMAAGLRQLALVVSGEAGRAAVAVEGRWDGTIEDPDLGTRRFELQLRTRGRPARRDAHHLARQDRAQGAGPGRRVRPRQRALHRRPAGHRVQLQGHPRGEHRHRHHRARRAGPRPRSPCASWSEVKAMPRVRTGLERLLDRPEPVRGLRVGLVANPSSITPDLVHASVGSEGPARGEARRPLRARARHRRRRAGPRRGRPLARPRDGPARPQPLRRDPRSPPRRCWPGSTRWCSTCRTWARATTRSSTRCST